MMTISLTHLHLERQYPKNEVITSRYTLLTFFPKSVFEQFRRLANVYFIVLGIIATVGAYASYYDTAVEPVGILFPVTVVVLISIIKEGVEDMKRHDADAQVNARPVRLLVRNRRSVDGVAGDDEADRDTGNDTMMVKTVQWRDLRVGSVVLLTNNEEVPADIALLSCSERDLHHEHDDHDGHEQDEHDGGERACDDDDESDKWEL